MKFIELVLLTLSTRFRSFLVFLSNGIYHFPLFIYVVGVIFQVGFNCKYGKHTSTYEITFLVCEPIVRILFIICSQ